MVHKHKHISPLVVPNPSDRSGDSFYNQHRYGPYQVDSRFYGDGNYSKAPISKNIYSEGPYNLTGVSYPNYSHSNWFVYTSDGMNRTENLYRSNGVISNVLTCPNRDEGDQVCKQSGNQFELPYLSEMPLVGNENRPNSISLIACVSGYSRCTLKSGSLSCTD